MLADLPGYGYAAVPKQDKIRWQQVMANYLLTRDNLRAVVLLCDPRHGLTELDDILLDVIRPRVEEGLKFLVLLTKADKLNRSEGAKALANCQIASRWRRSEIVFCAQKTRRGRSGHLVVRLDARLIQTITHKLPHGIDLHCRVTGEVPVKPVLLFLHGFPEAAFVWDDLLTHFAKPQNGGYRCVAPNMRGYAPSSAPAPMPSAYRAKHLVQDIAALIALESPAQPLAALVAHDWGGAVAWNVANQLPQCMQRLVILNAPHPGTFLRELQHSATQQAASAYMNFLIRPDAEALLQEDDYRRLWEFFTNMMPQRTVLKAVG